MVTWRVVNVVVVARLLKRLTLTDVYKKAKVGSYKPKNFSALQMKFSNPKATAIIFSTGKITVMGSRDVYSAFNVLRKIRQLIGVEFVNVSISNIVVNFDYGAPINLAGFYATHSETSNYDSNIFPSCTLKMVGHTVSANIFSSGKVMLTGIKDLDDVTGFIRVVYEKLQRSRDQQIASN